MGKPDELSAGSGAYGNRNPFLPFFLSHPRQGEMNRINAHAAYGCCCCVRVCPFDNFSHDLNGAHKMREQQNAIWR